MIRVVECLHVYQPLMLFHCHFFILANRRNRATERPAWAVSPAKAPQLPPIIYLWWLEPFLPERTNRSIAKAVRIEGHWYDVSFLGPIGVRRGACQLALHSQPFDLCRLDCFVHVRMIPQEIE